MSGRKYLIVPESDNGWIAVDPDTQIISELGLKDFQDEPQARSYFSFFDRSGVSWVSINSQIMNHSENSDEVLGLAIHEDFHHYRQTSTWFPQGRRVTELPLRWEPRLYRAQIERLLRWAIEDSKNRNLALSKAKYWYHLWEKNFPDEVASSTDGYEGSAEFAEKVGIALGKTSCQISETELRTLVARSLLKEMPLSQLNTLPQLDHEGYRLGSLAAFLLRFDLQNSDWLRNIENAVSPLESLMKNVATELTDEAQAGDLTNFKKQSEDKQKEVSETLSPLLDYINNPDLMFLSLPSQWQQGALSYRGFYFLNDLELQVSIMGQNFALQGEAGKMNVLNGAITLQTESPCVEGYGWTFPILKSQLKISEKGSFTVNSKIVSGEITGNIVKDAKGRDWLCASPWK